MVASTAREAHVLAQRFVVAALAVKRDPLLQVSSADQMGRAQSSAGRTRLCQVEIPNRPETPEAPSAGWYVGYSSTFVLAVRKSCFVKDTTLRFVPLLAEPSFVTCTTRT